MAGNPKRPKTKQDESPRVEFTTELAIGRTTHTYHYIVVERELMEGLAFPGRTRRCLCTINGQITFNCALLPSGQFKGKFIIAVNKANRAKLGIEAGDTIDVELVRDDSKYGMPMPPEFKEVLAQDPDGKKLFNALTPGKQRTLLWYTQKPKDEDRRIHNALVMIEHLKKNEGKIVWRELGEELKVRRDPGF